MTNTRHLSILSPPIVLILFWVAIDLCMPAVVVAKSSNSHASQWKKVGGRQLLAGQYKLAESWTTDGNHLGKGLYWHGGFYLPEDKRQYVSWKNAVKNEVAPEVGQITVEGPGVVVVFTKRKGPQIYLTNTKAKARFIPTTMDIEFFSGKWDRRWEGERLSPNAPLDAQQLKKFAYGKVPAGQTVTLDVSIHASSYNNLINTGELTYVAPQEMEYSVWFFPFEGGSVVKVLKTGPDGKKVDVTNNPSGTGSGTSGLGNGPNWKLDKNQSFAVRKTVEYMKKQASKLAATDKPMSDLLNLYADRIQNAHIFYKKKPMFGDGEASCSILGNITIYNAITSYTPFSKANVPGATYSDSQLGQVASILMHEVAHSEGANEWQAHLLQKLTFNALKVSKKAGMREFNKKYFKNYPKAGVYSQFFYTYWMK